MCNNIACEIPIEILGKIFLLLCLTPIDPFDLNCIKRLKHFPWAAGLVCKLWRHAFLSTPALWISLRPNNFHCPYYCDHINDDRDRDSVCDAETVRRLALYLERSNEHPLNLTISPQGLPHDAKSMLLSRSYRWRHACIYVCKPEISAQLNELLAFSGKIPILEELEIQESLLALGPPCRAFEIAPSLKRITFETRSQRICWIMPWSQLTTLHLRLQHVNQILDAGGTNVLGMLDNVEELHISLFDRFSTSMEPSSYTPRLKSLRILMVDHSFFLSLLEAPQLDELRLSGDPIDVDFARRLYSEDVSSLINRSSCKIRHLHLSDFGDLEDVNDTMVTAYDVEDLHFFNGHVIPALMHVNHNAVLPNLRSLTIGCGSVFRKPVFIKQLSKLLESRVRNPNGSSFPATYVPLEIVTLQLFHRHFDKIPPELWEVFRKWPSVVQVNWEES